MHINPYFLRILDITFVHHTFLFQTLMNVLLIHANTETVLMKSMVIHATVTSDTAEFIVKLVSSFVNILLVKLANIIHS